MLVFEPEEKSWGYSSFRFGGNLQFDTERTQTFNTIIAHTWGWLNDWGAEWRNELQFGETRRIKTEWHQPLGAASSWYLQPRFELERSLVDVYLDDESEKTPFGRYWTQQMTIDLSLGYEFGRTGALEVFGGYTWFRSKGDIGYGLEGYDYHVPFSGVSFGIDTLDNVNFPRRGLHLTADVQRVFNDSVDSSISGHLADTVWQVNADVPFAFDKNWSALVSATLGRSTIPGYFSLGGAFKLSGTPKGRFSGDHIASGRLMLMRKVLPSLAEAGFTTYVGVTYEAGRVYDGWQKMMNTEKKWRHANAIFVGADTWIGPMYVVLGRTYGVGDSIMFYWGRLQ